MDGLLTAFIYASYLSVIIPLFFLFFRKAYSRKRYILLLGAFLFIAAISDYVGYVFIQMNRSNIAIVNTFFILQFYFLGALYFDLFQKTNRFLVRAGLAVFTIVVVVNTFFIQGYQQLQSITLSASCVILSVFAIRFLIYSFEKEYLYYEESSCVFWINTAILYYFCANLWLFPISSFILSNFNSEYSAVIWMAHNLNNVAKNCMFAAALYWAGRNPAGWEKVGMN
jgi:hypothetical protein